MNKSPLTTILTGVLTLSALASLWFCYSGIKHSQEFRVLQSQLNMMTSISARIAAVGTESLEYSKTHPAINPILENAGLKPKSSAPAPAKTK